MAISLNDHAREYVRCPEGKLLGGRRGVAISPKLFSTPVAKHPTTWSWMTNIGSILDVKEAQTTTIMRFSPPITDGQQSSLFGEIASSRF